MSTRTYGILASVIGSAFGAWWLARRRAAAPVRNQVDRGTVIFDNTPTASSLSATGG